MGEIRHLRCDRCAVDAVVDDRARRADDDHWAYCMVGLNRFDFCPDCWRAMLGMKKDET
jgi:hypothetical protein